MRERVLVRAQTHRQMNTNTNTGQNENYNELPVHVIRMDETKRDESICTIELGCIHSGRRLFCSILYSARRSFRFVSFFVFDNKRK